MERVQLIVNPIAGKGRGPRVAPVLAGRLRRLGYDASIFVTRRRGDASAFAASLDWRTSLIVIVGGDGTLNEVVNGQTKIPMTIFPIGTGNAFAADQGIRGTLDALEAVLRTGAVEWFDLGDAGGRKFVNMASGGILGQIHQAFWEDRRGPDGFVRCLLLAFKILRRRNFAPVSVWGDGALVTRSARIVVVGNTRTYSPGIRFTPLASPSDGLLDVVTFPEPAGVDYLRWFVGVLRGRHLSQDGIGYLRARAVRLTGERVVCHVDGEYIGPAPLAVSVLPRSAPILVPVSSRTVAPSRTEAIPDPLVLAAEDPAEDPVRVSS
jgi:diacylglycerol kinase (ATP)